MKVRLYSEQFTTKIMKIDAVVIEKKLNFMPAGITLNVIMPAGAAGIITPIMPGTKGA